MPPDLNMQVAALGEAFIELVKMLGKRDGIAVTQLARALETKAKASGTTAEMGAALDELARRLRK